MTGQDHLVLVLDDDPSVLRGLDRLLKARGYRTRLHQTPETLFEEGMPDVPACLLLDNNLNNGKSGIQVHAEIIRLGWRLPTVFLTGHWNVQEVVSAIRAGADGFLTKPYDPEDLLANVAGALEHSRSRGTHHLDEAAARRLVATLTDREREVVCHVLAGKLNKEIAAELNLALITVKVHRGRAMKKLGAGNAAELARLANLAGLCPQRPNEAERTSRPHA